MKCFYDEAQILHAPETFLVAGRPQAIPEKPERITMLQRGLEKLGLKTTKSAAITRSALELVHTPRYLDFLENLRTRWAHVPNSSDIPLPNVYAIARGDMPVCGYPDAVVGQAGFHLGDGACPVTATTLAAATASAASALAAAAAVLAGDKMAYALCRPPGHHASSEIAGGFCFFNNAALAAAFLTREGKRVAILDIDVHHGNGTEAIFYARSDILTVSLHAHPARFYPFFWGYENERGTGAGEGFNLNIPLPRGTELAAYLENLDVALKRIAEFSPDIVVVAAGLDIAIDDPFQGFSIRTDEFTVIAKAIAALKKPCVIIQEGGYPSNSLGDNLAALLKGFSDGA